MRSQAGLHSLHCLNPGVCFGGTPELHKFGGSGEKRHCKPCLRGLSCAAVGLAGEQCVAGSKDRFCVSVRDWAGIAGSWLFLFSSYVSSP